MPHMPMSRDVPPATPAWSSPETSSTPCSIASPSTLAVADVDVDDPAWIFYTSGTTGRPKGAMLSHAVLGFVTVSWLADLTPLDERDVTLHAAPLSHGAGFHALAAVARAAHQVIPDTVSFDPTAILEVIRAHGVTNTWMVPTQIVMLTEAAERAGISGSDLPSLAVRRLRRGADHTGGGDSGAGPLRADLRATVRAGGDADDGDRAAA